MMGRTHYATGVCVGAYVAWGVRVALVPAPVGPIALPAYALQVLVAVGGALALTWLAGRAAYWPDLDHSGSHSTRKWGVFSRLAHSVVEAWSKAVFDMSATQKDKDAGDFRNHRGLTHFAVVAFALGAALGVAVWQLTRTSPAVVWGLAVGLVLAWYVAQKTRSDWRGLAVLLIAAPLVTALVPVPAGLDADTVGRVLGLGVALAVAAGMLAHDLGDAATLAGVPVLWPLKVRGHRYYPVHIRRKENLTRTRRDSPTERRIRWVSKALLVVPVLGWIPGFYETVFRALA